jgi:hypothetical protein
MAQPVGAERTGGYEFNNRLGDILVEILQFVECEGWPSPRHARGTPRGRCCRLALQMLGT